MLMIILWMKTILKKYIEYRQSNDDNTLKQEFINDLTICINNLAKRHYEDIEQLHQPGFILLYIPIEPCVNLIYSDIDFRKVLDLANSKNIIIIGIINCCLKTNKSTLGIKTPRKKC